MTDKVPVLSIVFMGISCLAGFAMPIGLFFYFRKRKKADILPFFVGCAVMFLFALVLESYAHRLILSSSIGIQIIKNTILYAIYGGLMAGIFEETGRLIAFKTVLKKYQNKDIDALMYGAGHGGFEAVFLLGLTMINNIVYAVMINNGTISSITSSLSGDSLTQMNLIIETMLTTSPYTFLAGIFERIFAATLQMVLSVIVWFSAKNTKQWYLYPAAIMIHAVVDGVAVIMSAYNVPVFMIEAAICVMAILAVLFARKVWNQYSG